MATRHFGVLRVLKDRGALERIIPERDYARKVISEKAMPGRRYERSRMAYETSRARVRDIMYFGVAIDDALAAGMIILYVGTLCGVAFKGRVD